MNLVLPNPFILAKPRLFIVAAMIVSLVGPGCQRPAAPEGPTAAKTAGADPEVLWEAALKALRRAQFQPDRMDRAQGVIVTLPATSRQWGEFWRHDVADGYSMAEASMHTTQRKVTVTFIHDKEWTVDVMVEVFRLSEPESQLTNASSVFQAFSHTLPTAEGALVLHGRPAKRWLPMGRDGMMESRLLGKILAYSGQG